MCVNGMYSILRGHIYAYRPYSMLYTIRIYYTDSHVIHYTSSLLVVG